MAGRASETTGFPRPPVLSRRTLIATGCATSALLLAEPVSARRPSSRSLIGRKWRSDLAAQQQTARGRTISSLGSHQGKVYLGYGDYFVNTGPLQLQRVDVRTGTLESPTMELPFEENSRMRLLDGALYAPNVDPRGYPLQAPPIATNASGTWSLSGPTNCVHVFDVELVPGTGDGIMVSGAYLDPNGESGAATWLSQDGGATWALYAEQPDATSAGRAYRVWRIGGNLYCVAGRTTYRWRGLWPTAARQPWAAGWEPVVLDTNEWTSWLGTDVRGAGNGTFYAGAIAAFYRSTAVVTAAAGPAGAQTKVIWGDLRDSTAFCSDTNGWVYVACKVGIARSRDGVRWERHPSPGIGATTGIVAESLAVAEGVIFVGDSDATVHAVCSTAARWRPADSSLAG